MSTASLRLDSVTRTFREGTSTTVAVDGASLEMRPGEIGLIMGPSGSGKTTLLAMCGALLRPTSGTVWIQGTDVTLLPERALPSLRLRRIGFVFQSGNLLANLTALENVRIVLRAGGSGRADADRRARDLLGELGLGRRTDARPGVLSGGERQRVGIARALANDPPLLLADEPTANLDSRAGHSLMDAVEALAKKHGKTVLIASHDQRIADVADRVMWLEDGRLEEAGAAAPATSTSIVTGERQRPSPPRRRPLRANTQRQPP